MAQASAEPLSDQNEHIISLSMEIARLRHDYDECDKENILLKLRIRNLEVLGTNNEMALVAQLQARLARYEPEFNISTLKGK